MTYILRELSRDDINEINSWRNNRDIISSLGAPFRFINRDVDDAWFSAYLNNRNANIRLAIIEENSSQIIGAVYLTGIDWLVRSGEFSVWIGRKEKQGKGAGRYATTAMLAHAFQDLGLNRIYLTVLSDNQAARSLYKKSGFTEEGTLRQAAFKNGEFKDMILMSMLAVDFQA